MSKVLRILEAAGIETYTREEWGSRYPNEYAERLRTHPMPPGPADYHFLHITVTRDGDTIRQGKEGARQVEGYGYSSPPMVSYQLLTTNEGRVFEGQNYGAKGTHTVNDKNVRGFPKNLNYHGYAVALMQNVQDEVTDIQVEVVAACFAAAELAGYVKIGAPIYPHRMFAEKACPGDKAMQRLGEIRRLKDELVKNGLENNVGANDVWNAPVPKVNDDGENGEQPAKWAVAHARIRATRAQAAAEAAFEQAKRNADGLRVLSERLDNLAPGIKAAVVEALGEEIKIKVIVGDGEA